MVTALLPSISFDFTIFPTHLSSRSCSLFRELYNRDNQDITCSNSCSQVYSVREFTNEIHVDVMNPVQTPTLQIWNKLLHIPFSWEGSIIKLILF